VEETQPHLFFLSIVLANSHRGKLSRLGGSVVGRHVVGSYRNSIQLRKVVNR
jgi:hypothetical protein